MESEFPGNSIHKKAVPKEAKPEKKIEAVVSSTSVTRRKRPLGKRFMDTFFSGASAKDVISGVFHDVLVPAIKDNAVDAWTEFGERAIHGSGPSGRRTVTRGAVNQLGHRVVNYSSASNPSPSKAERQTLSRRARSQHKFDEIIISSRVEALEILQSLRDIIAQYEAATVADFYLVIGQEGEYTDGQWGWTDLSNAEVARTKGGYLLDLPMPVPLD